MKTAKKNFLNIADHCGWKESRYVIVPFGYESTTSYGRGTARGPEAIIAASAMHAILPHISRLVSVGFRNFSADEAPVLEKHKGKIKIHWASEIRKNGIGGVIKSITKDLAGRDVYLPSMSMFSTFRKSARPPARPNRAGFSIMRSSSASTPFCRKSTWSAPISWNCAR